MRCSAAILMRIICVAKGHKIGPGRTLSSLTLAQVRMILRIYWTDRYQQQALGFNRCTPRLRERLARQFDVSVEVIKKIVGIRHNQNSRRRRVRFKTIKLQSIQSSVKHRLHQRGVQVAKRGVGRPRKEKAR